MLRSLDLDLPEQEAAKEFASTRKKALLRQIWPFLIIVGGSGLFTYWVSEDE